MSTDSFAGQSLPFSSQGWTRKIRSGTYRNGATYKQVEKIKVLGRGTMGSKLEEVHILASVDTDVGSNKIKNLRKGQHSLSLKKGLEELAFAVPVTSGWAVLAYDCSYYLIVKTQREAQEILEATNWRKWARKRSE